MSSAEVRVTPPEGTLLGTMARRVREVPWLAVQPLLHAAALVCVVVHLVGTSKAAYGAAMFLGLATAVLGGVAWFLVGDRFRRPPPAPDDAADPVRLEAWTGGLARSDGPSTAHVLADGLRLVGTQILPRDWALFSVLALVGLTGGLPGAAGTALWLFALGVPRRSRVQLDVPWDEVEATHVEGRQVFRIVGAGWSELAVVAAKYSQRERLSAALAARLEDRHQRPARPRVAGPDDERDAEAGVAEVVLRRARNRRSTLVALVLLGVSAALFTVGYLVESAPLRIAGGLTAFAAWIATIVAVRKVGTAWAHDPAAPGDVPDPVPVRWRNRPGWPGPRPQHVHLTPEAFRIVGREYEVWDVVVLTATALTVFLLAYSWSSGRMGTAIAAGGVISFLNALGIPRRRRVAVDVPWAEVERVEVRRERFVLLSRLPEPAARIEFEAKYAAREKLAAELSRRLGGRASGA